MRNVLGSAEMVAAAIRTIFAQPDQAAVAEPLDQIADKLGRQFPAVERMLREAQADILAGGETPSSASSAPALLAS
jgi:putative transposase